MLFYQYRDIPMYEISLETVEDLIFDRFQKYYSSDDLEYDPGNIDYDKIAHLFLSIIAIDYPYFKDSFLNGELKIFKERVKSKNCKEMNKELSEILQFLNSLPQIESFKNLNLKHTRHLSLVKSIIQILLLKCSHVFENSHLERCRKYKIIMPFTFPLKLVAKREVEVRNGKVSISCGKWHLLLNLVFEFVLKLELALLKKCDIIKRAVYECEDDRIRQIIKRFTEFLNGRLVTQGKALKAVDIDVESQYFPPCMANLHQILRQTHRLSYESRYQYTLFLKDIGLPVDENILFWKSEYSKPHQGSNCIHDWEEKQIRYNYQIQHMYGLIGDRHPRKSHSCQKFIQQLQTKMDGGCPFQHLTAEILREMLPKSLQLLPDIEDIFKYQSHNMPQKACSVYLQCQEKVLYKQTKNITRSKGFYVVSPLQYYNLSKNL